MKSPPPRPSPDLAPLAAIAIALAFPLTTLAGATVSAEDRLFFENKIRPALVTHCYECHSADAKELGGKLRLDSRVGLRNGGESGPAIVPGNPDESLIIQAIRRSDEHRMPPENPLPDPVIHDLVEWIKTGAPDPRSESPPHSPDADPSSSNHWAFQPIANPAPPKIQATNWPLDPLDHFVLANIESANQSPSKNARPETLIRRLYYDLLGLPPQHEEIKTFVADHATDSRQAIESLVDHLLASPHFGERWGRHWLDLARYGESNGNDGLGRNHTFPNAWRYRDYVIAALNADTPYDRFLTEQIAGDLLPFETAGQRNRQLTATGFLAIGAKPAAAMNNNFAMDVVDDQINVVSTAAMGLSVACARCHDHKHDPIPTRDYYAMAGIFKSTETLWGAAANEKLTAPPTPLHELRSSLEPTSPATPGSLPEFPSTYSTAIDNLNPTVHTNFATTPSNIILEKGITPQPAGYADTENGRIRLDTPVPADAYTVSFWFRNDVANNSRPITAYLFSHAADGDNDHVGDHIGIGGTHDKSMTGILYVWNGKGGNDALAGTTVIKEKTWNHVVMVRDKNRLRVFLNGWPKPEIDTEMAARAPENRKIFVAARNDNFAPLTGALAELAIFDRALTQEESTQLHAASGQKPKAPTSAEWAMGVRDLAKIEDCKINIDGNSKKLGPAVPRGFITACKTPGDISDQSGRLELAQWLTHPDHPLTARVIVNRIWLHLFGQAIVSTPDDFGIYGSPPTHPQLLDHLATRFASDGWSLKRLIRTIVLSRTYGLDSKLTDPQLAITDPDNLLFARHNRRRLDAESLRDSILQASGTLDPTPATGSAVARIDKLINWPPGEAAHLHQPSNHRSVYLCMLRNSPPPELAPFNFPDGRSVTGKRDVTIVPAQALFLMNNPFVVEQSRLLAEKIQRSNSRASDRERIVAAYQTVLQRPPTPAELNRAIAHLTENRTPDSFSSLCHALLASNEFRYID